MKKYFKNSRGFTLVETLVGLAIFTVSILALMSVLSSSITSTTYAKQKLTAEYLGQEGIEYIRNMRDTFILYDTTDPNPAQHGWDSFKSYLSSCTGLNVCYFDPDHYADGTDFNPADPNQPTTRIKIVSCGPACSSSTNLKYDSTTGEYGYTSGVDSGFRREINVTQITSDEVLILVTVFWKNGSKSVKFQENLYNWVE